MATLTQTTHMHVYIAGTGKLATELLASFRPDGAFDVSPWSARTVEKIPALVVHAGSGREIDSIAEFCRQTSSVLVELATGSSLEDCRPDYPLVLCPNTNILMLKVMCMLERSGNLFTGADVRLTESHQASKTSIPGTAVSMAKALGIEPPDIRSVRNTQVQLEECGIPPEHLGRHAFHRIEVHDGPCTMTMETRVYGDSPYASGVHQIIDAIQRRVLEARLYSINEFIENGWI